MDNNRTYTLTQCEEIFHVSHNTLLCWVKSGKLKATKIGKKWLVTEETVKEMLNKE